MGGWLWKKLYNWARKCREERIDKMYEKYEPVRMSEVDISGYINDKISPLCGACKVQHSKFCVTTWTLGNGGPTDRNYCADCFAIGGKKDE